MSIQFGDILKHNNLVYPIVDINDVKGGLRSIATFSSPALVSEYASIPEKYRSGYSLLLETSTGTIYYLAGLDATNVSHWSPVGVGGNGTGIPFTIPKWISSSVLGNSNITDNGDTVTINGNLMVIGTTSTISSENLLVKDPIILLAGSQSGTPTYDAGLFVNRGSSDTQAFIWDESEKEFKFITTTSGATVSGDVTIGTYSSVRTGVLSVGTGSRVNSRFIVSSSGGTVSFVVDEFGNVYNRGRGNISTNTAFGASALSLNVGGYENTAIGVNALLSNTSGSFNTALGLSSLRLSISGASNTAIGDSALYSNTTGDNNTAIGREALYFNIIGDSNTALGSNAGRYISGSSSGATNSNNSIFIGSDTRPQLDNQTNQIVIGVGATGNGSNTINLGSDSITKTYLKGSVYIGIRGGGTVSLVVDEFGNVYNNGNGGIATNTAFGASALSITSGYNNTAIGVNTLLSNTSGIRNTAIGSDALRLNNAGSSNTALGAFALYNNGNSDNTAIGSSALFTNTTGYANTAIGVSSLLLNTTGHANTALGYFSLSSNTTGNRNTAVGNSSLVSNTTGVDNVAVGYISLQNNTTGDGNTAIGNSLQNNRTGDGNTAIGYNSLLRNTMGDFNTALGYFSLYNNTTGVILDEFSFSPGNGYVDGVYSNVPLVYATGSNFITAPIVDIEIVSGEVVSVSTISYGGGFIDGTTIFTINSYGTYSVGSGFEIGILGFVSGSGNTALGYFSLFFNTTGSNNVAVGYNSLFSNTTGSDNIALGRNSLQSNISGISNITLGVQSLYSNTTGFSNTALGQQSLRSNTTGFYNTALGQESLYSNTTGSNNIAIGRSSLQSNTTGIVNIALGSGPLFTNTTGNRNIALGQSPLYFNTTGSNNIALGLQSLYNNTTGYDNTSLGFNSLFSNTTGWGNIALGISSLESNTTGDRNTALGYTAMRYYRGLWSVGLGGAALGGASTGIKTLSATFSPGTGYATGTYSNVRLQWSGIGTSWTAYSGSSHEYPTAEIVVGVGGTVSSVTLQQRGTLIPDTTTRFTVQTGTQSYHLGTASGNGFEIGIDTIDTATFNTALGYGAMYKLGVGSDNIAIGMWAGIYYGPTGSSGNLTGSDQSIFIGRFTSALNNDSVNEIVIGNDARGNGSNTVTLGNDSVIKTYLKGKVQLPTIPTNSGTYSGTYSTYHILTRNDTTGEVEKVRPNVDEIDAGTLTITLTYLTTTYPNATTGFKIYQHRPGFPTLIFEKTASIWIQYQANSTF